MDIQNDKVNAEISILNENNLLFEIGNIENIKYDLHLSKIWAEVFWRRLKNHSRRPDPEIELIKSINPSTVLEIGSAYGRVLTKIANVLGTDGKKITGIEICKKLEPYYNKYKLQYPVLNDTNIIFDDFFNSSRLEENSFDLIVLPMNTIHSFSFDFFNKILLKVKKLLKSNGKFIFSCSKISTQSLKEGRLKSEYGGELLLELGNYPIAMEYFSFDGNIGENGVESISYHFYNLFTKNYNLEYRQIYRVCNYYPYAEFLKETIENNGFKIELIDDKSHSLVYQIIPMLQTTKE